MTRDAAAQIETAIADLEGIANLPGFLDDGFPLLPERRRDYRAFWDQARLVNGLFKTSRLHPDIRRRLWTRHNSLCEQVKDLQQRERERNHQQSKLHRDEILSTIREARSWAKAATKFEHLAECRRCLGKATQQMKEKFLLKADLDECWSLWREVNEELPFRREEICDLNYSQYESEAHRIVNLATYGDPHEAFKAMQNLQRELKVAEIARHHKQHLWKILDEYWTVAKDRIEERRAERARKHEQWRSDMRSKIDRLEALIEKNEGVVARIRDHIDGLEEKIENAWNEDWADRARDWVREDYQKISDIEHTNEELAEKIREIRSKAD